jgi:hypothetical protein
MKHADGKTHKRHCPVRIRVFCCSVYLTMSAKLVKYSMHTVENSDINTLLLQLTTNSVARSVCDGYQY